MPKLMTVLDVVSQAAMEIGISQQRSTSVVSSADQDILQMGALLYQVADEILSEEPYMETLGDQLWIVGDAGTPKERFDADNDVILFDGRLAINGLKFRFLKAKGLEFGEEMRDFVTRLNKISGRANQRVLDLDTEESRVQ